MFLANPTGFFGLVLGSLRQAAHYAAAHTGIPVSVVAGAALVVSWRVFRRTLRFAVELALATTVVLVLSHLGWISF